MGVLTASYDVAIVGAGPAGSAAARLLAAWGHRVAAIERDVPAEGQDRKGLAESIPPSCRKLFDAIGALDLIDAAGFYRSTGNTVWWGSDEPRSESFGAGARGYQVERAPFDRLLRNHAVAAGAEFRNNRVREVKGIDPHVLLADGTRIGARFVLDCSGRAGVIARRGWRVEDHGEPRTVALVGVWTGPPGGVDPTHTLVESHEDGWAWSVPVAPDVRYVTAMVDPHRTQLARGRPGKEVYLTELGKARHLSEVIAQGTLDRGPWGSDASVYVASRYASASALLVGDAASFIDPLSSYGIKKALASAWLAAVAVHTALVDSSRTQPALEFFAAREAAMATALLRQTRAHFGDAALQHANPFWTDRASLVSLPSVSEPDVHDLRDDERVKRAFAELKERRALSLRRGAGLQTRLRPVVRGHEIAFEDRLFTDVLPEGVRFLRDVDVAGLLALAPAHKQVPDLFEAYNQRFPPVALPDFLGALSVMLAFGILEDSAASAG